MEAVLIIATIFASTVLTVLVLALASGGAKLIAQTWVHLKYDASKAQCERAGLAASQVAMAIAMLAIFAIIRFS